MKAKLLLFCSVIFTLTVTGCKKDNNSETCTAAPVVCAGKDTLVTNVNSFLLNASTTGDSGQWSILAGDGGILENSRLKNSRFTGNLNIAYLLKWESSNSCGTATDTMKVEFKTLISADSMVNKMHWLGQSDYKIDAGGTFIYIDHVATKANDHAGIVLITHSHGDHFSTAAIAKVADVNTVVIGPADCKYTGTCKIFRTLKPGEDTTINNSIKIKAVRAYNIVKAGNHPKASNWVGYVITVDGVTIYHAGDTERIPEMKDFDCDIAMLPLGQIYTMVTVNDAAEAAKDVKAEIAIPMHCGLYEGTVQDANTFKTLLDGVMKVVIKNRNRILNR